MKLDHLLVAASTALFAVLLIMGARTHPLWQDEAETGIYARNILTWGVPKGWDGVNLEGSFQYGIVLNDDLVNHVSPWVQYYLAAASFYLFGVSSFTARLPFLVIGILTIPITWLLAFRLTNRRAAALLSAVFLSLSVQYILYASAARHYIVSAGAGLLFLWSALALEKFRYKILFVASGVLFLYNNYLVFPVFYMTTLAASIAFHRLSGEPMRRVARFITMYCLLGVMIVALFAPWFFAVKPFSDAALIGRPSFRLWKFAIGVAASTYASSFHQTNVFPIGFTIFWLVTFLRDARARRVNPADGFLLTFILVYGASVVLIDSLTLEGNNDVSIVSYRYHTVLIALFMIASAMLMVRLARRRLVVAVLAVLLWFTNILTFTKPRSYLVDYIRETLNPYQTPDHAVAQYLRDYAQDGDTAFVSLDRAHEPLMFLLDKKIRFVNRIKPLDRRLFSSSGRTLPKYLSVFTGEPDWVIQYGTRGNDGTFATFDYRGEFPQGLSPSVDLVNHYDEIILPVFFQDRSRPELPFHSFTESEPPADEDRVFIYRRKR